MCQAPRSKLYQPSDRLPAAAPKESTEPWDYFKVVTKIPGDEAFTKLADSKCALLKK